jgi:hypothetical protein
VVGNLNATSSMLPLPAHLFLLHVGHYFKTMSLFSLFCTSSPTPHTALSLTHYLSHFLSLTLVEVIYELHHSHFYQNNCLGFVVNTPFNIFILLCYQKFYFFVSFFVYLFYCRLLVRPKVATGQWISLTGYWSGSIRNQCS